MKLKEMKLLIERGDKRFFSKWLFWLIFGLAIAVVLIINGFPLWLEYTARYKPSYSWRAHSFDAWTKGDDGRTYLVYIGGYIPVAHFIELRHADKEEGPYKNYVKFHIVPEKAKWGMEHETLYDKGELAVISLPGAPYSVKSPNQNWYGKWPDYHVEYWDETYRVKFAIKPKADYWYQYYRPSGVDGENPYKTGDWGIFQEVNLPIGVNGEIEFKKTGKVVKVSGLGSFSYSVGSPCSVFEWGRHDWGALSFPNGWASAFMYDQDDWQWGYNRRPHRLCVWDPIKKKYHEGANFRFVEYDFKYKEERDDNYPVHLRIRMQTDGGVYDVSYDVVSHDYVGYIKYVPWKGSIPTSHIYVRANGRFIYPDGTTVELKDGKGIVEHFERVFPDMINITPISFACLIVFLGLIFGFQYRDRRSCLPIVILCVIFSGIGLVAWTLAWLY